jgi:hypothetical protein
MLLISLLPFKLHHEVNYVIFCVINYLFLACLDGLHSPFLKQLPFGVFSCVAKNCISRYHMLTVQLIFLFFLFTFLLLTFNEKRPRFAVI